MGIGKTSSLRGRTVAVALAVAALGLPAAAQAASPGQICNTNDFAWVRVADSGYILLPGDGFRIVAYAGEEYFGHGNGRPDGFMHRSLINQSSCHD
jgi:hypothetical protein